ncbi:MAG: hypothetical protein JWR68_3453 [Polaromonas sp.]|nr:hypothetical protein [Polaromonas sp.]
MRVPALIQVFCLMVDKPFARKRSGGPKTAAGKAIVASNALSHGINSRLVTLPTEDPAEFDALFQALVADFRPNGTIETHIVHRIAHLIWKQRRLEGYEHQQMSQAAISAVKVEEIFKKMNLEPPSDSVHTLFELLDKFTEEDLGEAEALLSECHEFKQSLKAFMDPLTGPTLFPLLWRRAIPEEWRKDPSQIASLGLNSDEPNPEVMRIIADEVVSLRRHSWATILLIKKRDGIYQARAAIRAEKMTLAWNLDRSHRYHTLLEGQIYRALKELRSQQGWRLEQVANVVPNVPPPPPPPLGLVG